MEIWKDIKGYEGLYQVSNTGLVKSLRSGRNLKSGMSGAGYLTVALCLSGSQKTFTVHQLVAIAFLNHKPNKYKVIVDHINNVKTDNRIENLQLVTNRRNSTKDRTGYTSGYAGVYKNKNSNKWYSEIQINGEKLFLGSYGCELKAARAYQLALKQIENGEEIRKEKVKRQVRHNY